MIKSFAETEAAVLKIIGDKPQLSSEVREALTRDGFDPGQVRTVIANLWDQGQLNVGLDQRLQVPINSPAITYHTTPTKPLSEVRPSDVPRGLSPDDVATDYQWR